LLSYVGQRLKAQGRRYGKEILCLELNEMIILVILFILPNHNLDKKLPQKKKGFNDTTI